MEEGKHKDVEEKGTGKERDVLRVGGVRAGRWVDVDGWVGVAVGGCGWVGGCSGGWVHWVGKQMWAGTVFVNASRLSVSTEEELR